MRAFLIACLFMCSSVVAAMAQEKGKCSFRFRVDAQSSALHSLIEDASARGGFWRPIAEAPDDVQEIGKFIGRLAVCMRTPDDRPRTLVGANGVSHEIASPFISWCTAALLPGNRLITNRHCYYNPQLADIGFTVVDKVQINFGYTSQDFTGNVRTFSVASREQAQNAALDAMVLSVVGADANAILGGHVPMVMETQATPRRALTMIHHPNGEPLQFSAGTCQIDPRQAELPAEASVLRHRCETAPGSSGSLLLDSRSLAVVGLHNAGGLETNATYNTGHKIEMIEAALQLGFKPVGAPAPLPPPPVPEPVRPDTSFLELAEALQLSAVSERKVALERIVTTYPGTEAAKAAAAALASIAPPPPPVQQDEDTGRDTGNDAPVEKNTVVTHNAFGLTLAALTPSLRQSHKIDGSLNGLLVLAVDNNSPAASKGLVVGDVIAEASQQGVTSFAELQQRAEGARQAGRSSILFLVYRGNQPLFVAMTLSDF